MFKFMNIIDWIFKVGFGNFVFREINKKMKNEKNGEDVYIVEDNFRNYNGYFI